MNNCLLILLIILSLSALPLLVYPFRKSKIMILLLAPLFIAFLFLGYWHWGSWSVWKSHLAQEKIKERVNAVLQTIKSPAELIERMKSKINQNPKNSRGWYLLGRLYESQGQWFEAGEAFSKAYHLNPNNELIRLNYAQVLWQLNHQQINQQIQSILDSLLDKNPNQPDVLALLALDAFKNKNYEKAINYWHQLLQLSPEYSEESAMIKKAIAKADAMIDIRSEQLKK